ncbi:MAG: hypothetical protein IT174_08540 [Acidobacteria bacterium]|nr:hypothetical protein [Acidobacteriota bacterium]
MYRRPKFLEVLIKIREEMAREADYDTDLFAEMVRSGQSSAETASHPPAEAETNGAGRERPIGARKK